MICMTLPQYRRHECTIDGRLVHLCPQATELLATMLVSGPDRFLNADMLVQALWPDPDLEPNWAEVMIWRYVLWLRRAGIPIENAYSFGWRIPRHAREAQPERLAA